MPVLNSKLSQSGKEQLGLPSLTGFAQETYHVIVPLLTAWLVVSVRADLTSIAKGWRNLQPSEFPGE